MNALPILAGAVLILGSVVMILFIRLLRANTFLERKLFDLENRIDRVNRNTDRELARCRDEINALPLKKAKSDKKDKKDKDKNEIKTLKEEVNKLKTHVKILMEV